MKPFTILIDTREQTPWSFPDEVPTKNNASLPTGDYTVEGLERFIVVERKSVADFVGCVGRGRERFEREMHRMQAYKHACVIIEGSLRKLNGGNWRGQITPAQALGSIAAWRLRYKLHFIYADNAELAAEEALRFMQRFYEDCVKFGKMFQE